MQSHLAHVDECTKALEVLAHFERSEGGAGGPSQIPAVSLPRASATSLCYNPIAKEEARMKVTKIVEVPILWMHDGTEPIGMFISGGGERAEKMLEAFGEGTHFRLVPEVLDGKLIGLSLEMTLPYPNHDR